MGLLDTVDWQGKVFKGGDWPPWITMRGEPAQYPF